MAKQPIKYWETEVEPVKSASELMEILVSGGASHTTVEWSAGRPVGIAFTMPHDRLGSLRIRLRARTDLVLKKLRAATKPGPRTDPDEHRARLEARSERIVWRHLKDLTEQQLMAAELGQYDLAELFLANVEIRTPKGDQEFGTWFMDALESGQIPRAADGPLMLPPAGGFDG